MREWESVEKKPEEDLDKRLRAYYGPQLREQPLGQASWLHLRSQLGAQRPAKRWHLRKLRLPSLRRLGWRRQPIPVYIQEAFEQIAYEARVSASPVLLHYVVSSRVHVPMVRVSLLRRHPIKVILPSSGKREVEQSELDVVLATGLARYHYLRKSGFMLAHLLMALFVLLCTVGLLWWWLHSHSLFAFPIAILLYITAAGATHTIGRKAAFQSDKLIVLWLGRSRTCRGLHELSDHSRSPHKRGWREPSLSERIERVCGTRVEVKDEHLTLVR